MKIIRCLYTAAALLLFSSVYKAQEIKWENISLGFSVQYLFTDGDLNRYWGNTFAGGVLINYKIDETFSLEGGLLGAYLKYNREPEKIPNIIFLNIPAGLKYSADIAGNFKINLWAGIQNHSFIYSGKAAKLVEENDIEHELGLFIQGGVEVLTFKDVGLEVNTKIQNVFTLPEQLKIINIGLTFYFY